MKYTVSFSRATCFLQTLDTVQGLGYNISIGSFSFFFFHFLLLSPHWHKTRKTKKRVSWIFFSTTCIILITPKPSSSILCSFFLQRSSCYPTTHFHCQLFKPLLILMHLFDAQCASETNIRSGSTAYVCNSIVIFSVLFLFYSAHIWISNVLFNHYCTCKEKVFI